MSIAQANGGGSRDDRIYYQAYRRHPAGQWNEFESKPYDSTSVTESRVGLVDVEIHPIGRCSTFRRIDVGSRIRPQRRQAPTVPDRT